MKVLMVNGSPHIKGCTYTALEEVGKGLQECGIDYEIFQLGARPVRDCIGCNKCQGNGCIFKDDNDDAVNRFLEKPKKPTASSLGLPFTSLIPADRFCLSWTAFSIRRPSVNFIPSLPANPAQLSFRPPRRHDGIH